MALDSGLKPLIAFAGRLCSYLHGIVACARYRFNIRVLNGMNNRNKVFIRMVDS
jgi:hypothetical protein